MNSRPKLSPASFFDLLKSTGAAFGEDRIYRHAAALAYFTVFSLSPLLLVVISIAAIYFQDASKSMDAIKLQIEGTVGPTAAKAVGEMIQTANNHGASTSKPITATVIAFAVALWGASGLFGALQDSLNSIWGVMPKPEGGLMNMVRTRFVSFSMVLGVGFLLLVSLLLSTALSAVSHAMSGALGALGDSAWVAEGLTSLLGLGISMLLFGAIFKVLPDAKIQWRDVWVGAFVTAILFTIGRFALSKYLGRPAVASAYGSAGALIVLLLWVNYASTILFAGAEFTKAYANKFGSKILPDENAVAITAEMRAKQGLSPTTSQPGIAGTPKTEVVVPNRPGFTTAQKHELEHTLAVVVGGALTMWWFLRRRAVK